jgi:organic radical activating enzyme
MKVINETAELPLMEAFYTIQGEGHFSGNSAYFIRLAGCDVGCVWCDVKDSWDASKWPKQSVESILKAALNYPARLAVVTGGEPLMYDLTELTNQLHRANFKTNIETSGAHPLTGDWDWLCFSPKKFMAPKEEFYKAAHELKVIIYNKSDLAWAESHAAKVNEHCILYMQPEWDKSDKILPEVIEYVKNNPKWKISLQTHKFMNIP